MQTADRALVFFNPETIAHKKLEPISKEQVFNAFNSDQLQVFTNAGELFSLLKKIKWFNKNLLIMTSGNFSGMDLKGFAEIVCK